jgi:hypothetical protein
MFISNMRLLLVESVCTDLHKQENVKNLGQSLGRLKPGVDCINRSL